MRLASRFGRYNSIRRERPLTDDELMQFVPSVFSGDKHESRSERYTYIPTGKGILTGKKFLKLSCLIHMMVHPVIR